MRKPGRHLKIRNKVYVDLPYSTYMFSYCAVPGTYSTYTLAGIFCLGLLAAAKGTAHRAHSAAKARDESPAAVTPGTKQGCRLSTKLHEVDGRHLTRVMGHSFRCLQPKDTQVTTTVSTAVSAIVRAPTFRTTSQLYCIVASAVCKWRYEGGVVSAFVLFFVAFASYRLLKKQLNLHYVYTWYARYRQVQAAPPKLCQPLYVQLLAVVYIDL